MGVASAHLLHQPCGRPGMQSVWVGDDEAARQLVGIVGRLDDRRNGRLPEVPDLSGQRTGRFGGDLVDRRATGRGHRGDHQTLDERSGAQHHPVARIVVQQFQCEFGR